jgi:hypothetical protein
MIITVNCPKVEFLLIPSSTVGGLRVLEWDETLNE